jgi:serine/threonine protein kinase
MMIKDNPAILPSGTQVHEYVIEDVLGTGSFGITYKATDTHLGNSVVIKEYIPESFARRAENNCVSAKSDDTMEIFSWGRERFLDEAKTLAKFHHPNIVRVNRYFMANDTAYFVMDFHEGETLQSILSRTDKPLSESMIISIFTQILNGLSVVHQQKYLHRDIKPGNIYIRKDNTAILIDFGAARLEMPGDGSTTVVVTAGYAPVELYVPDEKKGPWTDIYSIGATIYRCLTKEAPPVSIERQKKLEDFGVDPCPTLLKDMPQLGSRVLLDSVDWMMSIAAEARPQSVQDVLDIWAGKKRRSNPVKPLASDPQKSKTQYKILIAGSAGAGVSTALQVIRDPETPGTGAITKPSGEGSNTQMLSLDFASLDISEYERVLLYSVPEQAQFNVVRDMLQNGAVGLVLLIDNGSKNPFDDLDCYLKLLDGFIENTGVVIGINRSKEHPSPTIHDYHSHLAKSRRNGKAPPPIMEVAPGNRQEMKKLLLSLLFHLNPSL